MFNRLFLATHTPSTKNLTFLLAMSMWIFTLDLGLIS